MEVREATPGDAVGVRGVVDAAALSLDGVDLGARIDAGDVLVAVSDAGVVVGACVLVPGETWHVEAVAVRRGRRGQGIGSALLGRAAERGPLTAAFDADVRPFYDSLGFVVEERDGRLWGRRG